MSATGDPTKLAANPEEEEAIAAAIQKLSPAEAEFFLHKLERSIAKRRVQLWGYLISLLVWAVVMFFSLALYGASDPASFRSWIFALPFLAIGLVLYLAGALAERVGKAPPKRPFRDAVAAGAAKVASAGGTGDGGAAATPGGEAADDDEAKRERRKAPPKSGPR